MTFKTPYHNASFLLSAASLEQMPADEGGEVAFIGRSNAGKSSAINTVTGIKGLARSSKTPGRTQTILFFRLDDHRRFVDLPGYGYAKVPLHHRQHLEDAVDRYLQTRRCLKGLILIMDIRHPLKDSDQQIIQWATQCKVPLHILLSKCDKLGHGAATTALRQVEQNLQQIVSEPVSVQLFSSLDRIGLDHVWTVLDHWLF